MKKEQREDDEGEKVKDVHWRSSHENGGGWV